MKQVISKINLGGFITLLSLILYMGFVNLGYSNTKIEVVKSQKGITAWLVEEHSLPIISIKFGFNGGSSYNPDDKLGISYFISGLLDEGAGNLDSRAFQQRLEDLSISLSYDSYYDQFHGSLKTLTQNKEDAFNLLTLSLNEPRFDAEPVERIRRQILTILKREEKDPNKRLSKAWFKLAYPNHAYGKPYKGSVDSLTSISVDNLRTYTKNLITKDSLKIAVVGNITPKELAPLLDKAFGDLPDKGELREVFDVEVSDSETVKVIEEDIPQSIIQFGFKGMKRADPDFIPAYVMNFILGGGGFSTRLTEEVREKRGLTYSISTFLYPLDHSGIFIGNFSTKNSSAKEALDVIVAEIEKMKNGEISEIELNNAKDYLTGSYPLRFDTSSKIASQLLGVQMEDLGIDFIKTRNDKIKKVTIDDVKRVAKSLFGDYKMTLVAIGKPDGIKTSKYLVDQEHAIKAKIEAEKKAIEEAKSSDNKKDQPKDIPEKLLKDIPKDIKSGADSGK